MQKVSDDKLLDVVKQGKGLTVREVTDLSGYGPGSEGLVMLRLLYLTNLGKVRLEIRRRPDAKPTRYWWPL